MSFWKKLPVTFQISVALFCVEGISLLYVSHFMPCPQATLRPSLGIALTCLSLYHRAQ